MYDLLINKLYSTNSHSESYRYSAIYKNLFNTVSACVSNMLSDLSISNYSILIDANKDHISNLKVYDYNYETFTNLRFHAETNIKDFLETNNYIFKIKKITKYNIKYCEFQPLLVEFESEHSSMIDDATFGILFEDLKLFDLLDKDEVKKYLIGKEHDDINSKGDDNNG